MFKRFTAAAVLVGSLALLAASAAFSSPPAGSSFPSGQRMYGHTSFVPGTNPATPDFTGHFVGGGGTVESAYDDATGSLIYLQTPNNAQVHPAKKIDPTTGLPVNVAPLYIPVYPVGSGIDPLSLNCSHVVSKTDLTVADNCPDHGPAVAFLAQVASGNSDVSTVYADGVLGHDHLAGIASTGGDFNVLWEPVVVLFKTMDAAKVHPTTLSGINDAVNAGNAIEIPLPQLDFNCAPVSAARYWKSTPAPTVAPPEGP